MFTGKNLSAETIQNFINNPVNAINIASDAHHSMDKKLAWGIEAKLVDDEVRVLRLCGVAADPQADTTQTVEILFPCR